MESERLARLEEKVERIPIIEQKLDRFSERFNLSLGKILGASAVVAVLASLAISYMRG